VKGKGRKAKSEREKLEKAPLFLSGYNKKGGLRANKQKGMFISF
jgi:hypothetical protein